MLHAGFICFGEVNTPIEIIEQKRLKAIQELEELPIKITVNQIVRDDEEGLSVIKVVEALRQNPADMLIICVAGWIPTHAIISITSIFKDKPFILWGLAGFYHEDRFVTTADQAGTSAARSVFDELGYNYSYIYSSADSDSHKIKLKRTVNSIAALKALEKAKIGMMGYRDMKLYGTTFDAVSLKAKFGVELEFFEMLEMWQEMENMSTLDISAVITHIRESWKIEGKIEDKTLLKPVSLYLALKEKIKKNGYEAVSLNDVDGVKKLMEFPPASVFMLLGEDPGVCTIPENDSLGAVTQLISHYLTGQSAPYFEFYEFMSDRVLMGVPDFIPTDCVKGQVKVVEKSFGDFGSGLLNISKPKTGRVTLARLAYSHGEYVLHLATGEAVEARAWEEAGWDYPAPQLPSLEIILDEPVENFAQNVFSQHYIISFGDFVEQFKNFCKMAHIKIII